MDIHHYKRRLEMIEKKIQSSEEFSQKNKQIIKNFVNDLIASNVVAAKVSGYLTDIFFVGLLKYNIFLISKPKIKGNISPVKRTSQEEKMIETVCNHYYPGCSDACCLYKNPNSIYEEGERKEKINEPKRLEIVIKIL